MHDIHVFQNKKCMFNVVCVCQLLYIVLVIQVEVFRFVTPCSVVVGYHHFRDPCCLHIHGEVTDDGEKMA
jgi:hypothetical protein